MIKLKDLLFESHNDSDDTAGILYFYCDEVLLCQGENSGKWNAPKGHIIIGEEPLRGRLENLQKKLKYYLMIYLILN